MKRDQPVRTLIVDDEPLARRRLRNLLQREDEIEIVGEAVNGSAAVRAIAEQRPDLVLLDIQMPGKNGFDVLEEIAGVHDPVVVFVTAHDDHAIRAFEVEAVDYVLKPVVEDRLRAAVRRAIARLDEQSRGDIARSMAQLLERVRLDRQQESQRLAIRQDGRVRFVSVQDIDRVEAAGDVVRVHAGRETHTMRATMAELEAKLAPPRFVRVHRSTIVNARRIREIQPWFKGGYVLLLHDGTKVRSGRSYRANVQALLHDAR